MQSPHNSPSSTRPARSFDLLAASLIVIGLLIAVSQLVATRWAEYLELVRTLTLLGAFAGLALGYSRLSPLLASFFAIIYGLFAIPWQLGQMVGPGVLWGERLLSISVRVETAVVQLAQQQQVTDNALFLTLMGLLFWTLSVYAGFVVTRRRQSWRAVFPAGLTMIVIYTYSRTNAWMLGLYIFLALLLVARVSVLNWQVQWRRTRTLLPSEFGLEMVGATFVGAILLLLLAWNAPAISAGLPSAGQAWRQVSQPWEAVRDRLEPLFGTFTGPPRGVSDYYDNTLALGTGNLLTEDVVLTVMAPPRPAAVARYYWRARHYSDYADGLWEDSALETGAVRPDQASLAFPAYEGRWDASLEFTTHKAISTLYTVTQPEWVSRPIEAEFITYPDGAVDIAALRAQPPLMSNETYSVRASLSNVTIAALRKAGTAYPDWISDHYLQLPESITPRTRALAHQITAGLNNPYDRATAITEYLRENIAYSDTVPTPPLDQEPIDWLLFDLQQGFCNYYATAEVMLLREIGIPARLTVGYSSGERVVDPILEDPLEESPFGREFFLEAQATQEVYRVRQRNAHAWPEVYFPGIGWVEFEPTGNQLPLLRPSGEEPGFEEGSFTDPEPLEQEELDEFNTVLEPEQPLPEPGSRRSMWVVSLSAGLLFLFLLWRRLRARGLPPLLVLLDRGLQRLGVRGTFAARIHRWARYVSLPPLIRAYHEINRTLARLGVRPAPADTPAERAEALLQLIPAAAEPTQVLLTQYHAAVYSPRIGNAELARQASLALRWLSYRAMLRRIFIRPQR